MSVTVFCVWDRRCLRRRVIPQLFRNVRNLGEISVRVSCEDTRTEDCPSVFRKTSSMQFSEALEVAKTLPKTELHLHLDGSLSPEFIMKRAAARGVEVPATRQGLRQLIDQMKGELKAKGGDARAMTMVDPKKNWPIFDFMNQFLQTEEELSEATFLLCSSLKLDHNVALAEIRFCPSLHTVEGLTEDQAVCAVVAGFERARKEVAIRGGVIICALRSYPAPHPLQMAQLARDHLGQGVVGFDVAGSENYALSLPPILESLRACKEWGVPITVHAGELPQGMIPNLRTALDLGVDRIGHGVALAFGDAVETQESSSLLARVAESRVCVEVCLTSICTAARVPSYAEHPLRKMLAAGVSVALSSDNITLSGDPAVAGRYPLFEESSYGYPSGEVAHMVSDLGCTWAEVRAVLMHGARATFANEEGFVAEYEKQLDTALKKAEVA